MRHVEQLKDYIYKSLYKNSEEPEQENLNTKIHMIYKDTYGKDFDTEAYLQEQKSLFLTGMPGSGKLARLVEVTQEVCAELTLNYVDYYANALNFSKKDLVVSIHDNYGDSSFLFGSIPQGFTIDQIAQKEIMMKKSLCSILVLDTIDELSSEKQKQLAQSLSNGEIGKDTLLVFTSTKPVSELEPELQKQLEVIEHKKPTLDKISQLRERFETIFISSDQQKSNKIR